MIFRGGRCLETRKEPTWHAKVIQAQQMKSAGGAVSGSFGLLGEPLETCIASIGDVRSQQRHPVYAVDALPERLRGDHYNNRPDSALHNIFV
jgi:hypothetical protein